MREKWLWVKRPREEYQGRNLILKESQVKHTSVPQQAEVLATYLSTKHWAPPTQPPPSQEHQTKLPGEILFELSPFTAEELNRVFKAMKTRKVAGPDAIPSELWKGLDGGNRELLQDFLNLCWSTGKAPHKPE